MILNIDKRSSPIVYDTKLWTAVTQTHNITPRLSQKSQVYQSDEYKVSRPNKAQ